MFSLLISDKHPFNRAFGTKTDLLQTQKFKRSVNRHRSVNTNPLGNPGIATQGKLPLRTGKWESERKKKKDGYSKIKKIR